MAGRRGTRWGARKVWRLGPYFRRYSASVTATGSKAGWTSQGVAAGRATANFTTGRWTYDTVGPGSASGDIPAWVMRALPRWLVRQPDGTVPARSGR